VEWESPARVAIVRGRTTLQTSVAAFSWSNFLPARRMWPTAEIVSRFCTHRVLAQTILFSPSLSTIVCSALSVCYHSAPMAALAVSLVVGPLVSLVKEKLSNYLLD
jgi:hypothetical protein